MTFFDLEKLQQFPTEAFTARAPFPWFDFAGLLTGDGFAALLAEFPPLALFERHQGKPRGHGQRPHNRYYLAYEHSIYHRQQEEGGTIKHRDLPPVWRAFLDEIQNGSAYRTFCERLLGVPSLSMRFAWHIGVTGNEVSPHHDSKSKVGTHILYFNTREDWNPAWGGSTLLLLGKKVAALNPDFDDFEKQIPCTLTDNHSLFFKNAPDAWHGTPTLTCPPGHHRRLFNVIFGSAFERTASDQRRSTIK